MVNEDNLIRYNALDFAMQLNRDKDSTPELILEDAEKFYTFLATEVI